jgi:hypothetical protein
MDRDDPERRIAELERQLAERKRFAGPEPQHADAMGSSHGDTPTAAPPQPSPMPPAPYGVGLGPPNGGLYGMGPAGPGFRRWQLRRPLRRWRLVWMLALFWLVMIPLGNVLGGVFMRQQHYPSYSTPGVTQGTWTSSTPPTTGSLTVSPGGVLSAGGLNQAQTIARTDGTLNLSGNNNTFTVTGHCLSLQVSGYALNVSVDSADTIDAVGAHITTIYHSGTPKITKSGMDVTVSQG